MTDKERNEYEKLKAQAERRKAYDRERYQRARRALAFALAQGASLVPPTGDEGGPESSE